MGTKQNYHQLLKDYIGLCEDIVTVSRHDSPFYNVWQAYKHKFRAEPIPVEVIVYEDEPRARAIVRLDKGDILPPEPIINNVDTKAQWKVKASYLKKILDNPDYYKQNPAQLDWSWLSEIKT